MFILLFSACHSLNETVHDPVELMDEYYDGFGVRRILLDPGHGCTDPGAQMQIPFGRSPMPKVPSEAEINLRAARVIQTHLEATGHYEVILSHEGHNCPSLGRRASMASKTGADVLISIHSDSGAPLTEGSWLIWSKHGYAAKQAAQNQWLATALGAGLYTHGFPLYHKDVSYDPSKKQSERYLKTHDHYAAHIDNGSKGLYLLKKSKVPLF